MAESTSIDGAQKERPPVDEARAIAASAAALLREFVEEDVTDFERLELPPQGAEQPGSSRSASPALAPLAPLAPSGSRLASIGRGASSQPVKSAQTQPGGSSSTSSAPSASAGHSSALIADESPAAGTAQAGVVPWANRRPSLEEVAEHLGECQRCSLAEGRTKIVFGDGNPNADIMFIGEGPGEHEDRQGVPFVGRAGELLTQMIEKGIGISRSDVYICNIVKCRPPENRNPLPPEVGSCRPFLDGQIQAIAPKVIVTLGKPAASLLLDRDIAITRVRGTWHDYQGIPLMPTLHPAYVLRQYTEANRRAVWQDLKAAFERSGA